MTRIEDGIPVPPKNPGGRPKDKPCNHRKTGELICNECKLERQRAALKYVKKKRA